jgi:hypothetical protein
MSFRRNDLKAVVKTLLTSGQLLDAKNVHTTVQKFSKLRGPHVTISVPDTNEERVTMPAATGRRKQTFTVRLLMYMVATEKSVSAVEEAFNDTVDQIIEVIRQNPQPDARILAFGVDSIRSRISDPQLADNEGNVVYGAQIEFPVIVHQVG